MSDTFRFAGIYPLSAVSHKQLSGFDCEKISLNSWLEQRARSNEVAGGSRTYVLLTLDGEVAGFYRNSRKTIDFNRWIQSEGFVIYIAF